MLLAVDIGNTNITFGIFDNENLLETLRILSDINLSQNVYENKISLLLKKYSVKECIIASVVEELTDTIKLSIDKLFNINSLVLNNSNLNLKIKTDNPEKVGADRVANVYAANFLYKKPSIVIDLGTATTFDIINQEGDFIGGIIMPGLNLQLKSLYDNTSKLPKIEVDDVNCVIGTDTRDNILSGVVRGTACAIEGLLNQCEKELGQTVTTIATGGYSEFISEYMERKFDYINPNLTLEGLKIFYRTVKKD